MRFCFIHAADLHVGSPLAALGLRERAVAERFAQAGRQAVERLIDEAIAAKAAFLLISGDIFDGDWKDVATGLFFARALGRLDRAGIAAFIVKGNHDAVNVMSRSLPYPDGVRIFPADAALSIPLDPFGVVLHGRSFGARTVSDDFVASYPPRREGALNIGLLHTSLDGARGQSAQGSQGSQGAYAPCTLATLRGFGYDYWALGHIHTAEIVCRDPFIVYPGNIQGRSAREPGPKGAMRVTVDAGRIVAVDPLTLDAARWAHERLDVSACADEAELFACIEARLEQLRPDLDGRPLAARLTLAGTTHLHARLVARREDVEAEARAIGFRFADDCWIEKLAVETRAPAERADDKGEPDAIDVAGLVGAAMNDPDYPAIANGLLASVLEKLPADLRENFPLSAAAPDRLAELARDQLLGALAMDNGA